LLLVVLAGIVNREARHRKRRQPRTGQLASVIATDASKRQGVVRSVAPLLSSVGAIKKILER
ncbi:MAG: hypothetical protein O7C61_11765, partial [SAR324 cluster bacterium]|nr:hypothetical protein [SAR324 cluster bacterium]